MKERVINLVISAAIVVLIGGVIFWALSSTPVSVHRSTHISLVIHYQESSSPNSPSSSPPGSLSGAPHPPKTHLWTLTCSPTGGTHPNPVAACKELSLYAKHIEPGFNAIECAGMILGDATVTVTGTIDGVKINYSHSRSCSD